MHLFSEEKQPLSLPDAEIVYYPNFLSTAEADRYFDILLKETPWQQDNITVFGKTYPQPRLTALYGEAGKPYTYSGITMHPHPFTEPLLGLKKKVEDVVEAHFTTLLLNLYRDGNDSNGWHADDEKELGKNPIIASVSLGASRSFHLKHKKDKSLKHKIQLEHGSLLVMKGTTQEFWKHQIPKTKKDVGPRINGTFRIISR
ncbi:alpha-ketoglutarate-dependent dioxygenase AlkB family protein [Luteirhabdus pelagi]|uniref:alpha-ketoglutarate-dependent dioxygenase AlkB family protein n=1 Tax=Luteirhabdus pelagi TaxID=2792783 RepID=UPI0019395379|nr:alpha-ketoglutarate-dependent dioxygenase AlkB [Luteirhabdus pelagi]